MRLTQASVHTCNSMKPVASIGTPGGVRGGKRRRVGCESEYVGVLVSKR